MAKTKVTPRKEPKCPMCPFRSSVTEAMRAHIVLCGMRKMEMALKCDQCDYVTNKSGNLQRHKKRHSVSKELKGDQHKDDQEEWLRSDPGSLDNILGEFESDASPSSVGHKDSESSSSSSDEDENKTDPTVRKQTTPGPVFAPKRKFSEQISDKSAKELVKSKWESGPQKVPKISHPPQFRQPVLKDHSISFGTEPVKVVVPIVPEKNAERISIASQTEAARSRRVVWKTTRYQEGDRQIEIVEMDETEYVEG